MPNIHLYVHSSCGKVIENLCINFKYKIHKSFAFFSKENMHYITLHSHKLRCCEDIIWWILVRTSIWSGLLQFVFRLTILTYLWFGFRLTYCYTYECNCGLLSQGSYFLECSVPSEQYNRIDRMIWCWLPWHSSYHLKPHVLL